MELFGGYLSLAFPTDVFGIIIADDRHQDGWNAFPQVFYRAVKEYKTVGFGGNGLAGASARQVEQDGAFLKLPVFLMAEKRFIRLQFLFQDGVHRFAVCLAIDHQVKRAVAARIYFAVIVLDPFD